MNTLFENIGSLLTFHPLAQERRGHSIQEKDLGLLTDAWLFCFDGKVSSFGMGKVPAEILKKADNKKNFRGKFLMPGLVDSHTHALFGGNRHSEFVKRLNGSTYQEIAASGGGIRSSMKATREASDEDLIQSTLRNIQSFQRHGVSTVEIKTGYGLSVPQELRLARLLNSVKSQTQSHIVRTCLALHDSSPEHQKLDDYVEAITKDMLPTLIQEKLVDYVDAFIETGYYSHQQVEGFMQAAKKAGFGIRLHADEFTWAQGAQSAARWGAASADHLQCATEADAKALAASKTVATLLPGTSLYTGIRFTDARPFLNAGCAVAIATDFNPGSSYFMNLAQLTALGAIHCHFKSWQALAAVTYVPALSLGLGAQKGALSPGFDADFAVYGMEGPAHWLGDMGQTPPEELWIRGKSVTL